MNHASYPLSDILPWGNPISLAGIGKMLTSYVNYNDTTSPIVVERDFRTLLVTDTASTDGRFFLHTVAMQFLSSRYVSSAGFDDFGDRENTKKMSSVEGGVLWISCAPTAERQILMGLRKAKQHNLGADTSWSDESGITKDFEKRGINSTGFCRGGKMGNGSFGKIDIISIPQELATAALLHDEHDEHMFSYEEYLKGVHKRIVHWLKYRELMHIEWCQQQQGQQEPRLNAEYTTLGPNLIICDDVTTLATLVGERLANTFVSSIQSTMRKISWGSTTPLDASIVKKNCRVPDMIVTTTDLFVLRASSPDDGGLYNFDVENESSIKEQKLRSEYSRLLRPWLGHGSGKLFNSVDGASTTTSIACLEEQCNYLSFSHDSSPSFLHRSGLYEVVDGVVDVSPLQSGYARDVLGRIAFVPTWRGEGWWGMGNAGSASSKQHIDRAYASLCVNYRCDDSGIRIMRLRSG